MNEAWWVPGWWIPGGGSTVEGKHLDACVGASDKQRRFQSQAWMPRTEGGGEGKKPWTESRGMLGVERGGRDTREGKSRSSKKVERPGDQGLQRAPGFGFYSWSQVLRKTHVLQIFLIRSGRFSYIFSPLFSLLFLEFLLGKIFWTDHLIFFTFSHIFFSHLCCSTFSVISSLSSFLSSSDYYFLML